MFSWTRAAQFVGAARIGNGTMVNKWFFAYKGDSFELLTRTDNSTPVIVQENITLPEVGQYNVTLLFAPTQNTNESWFLANQTAPWAKQLWAGFNRTDFEVPPVCPAAPGGDRPRTQEVYIFHPRHLFNISQQDLSLIHI